MFLSAIVTLFIRPLDTIVDLLWPPRHRIDSVESDIAAAQARHHD